MAKTEAKSVEEVLSTLFELQSIDSKVDEIKILKGELPMEVSDLEDDIAGVQTRINKLNESIDEIKADIANHNKNIHEAEALIERYERQLDNVKNNREYDALTKELELQKLEIQLSKKRIGEAEIGQSAKEATLATNSERLAGLQENLDRKKAELEDIIAKTEKEETKLNKASAKARKSIEARLLKAYDRIRNNYRNGLAVVPVNRASCGGCYNKIPPQTIIEIGQSKNVIACEHCGRVLVSDKIAGIESED